MKIGGEGRSGWDQANKPKPCGPLKRTTRSPYGWERHNVLQTRSGSGLQSKFTPPPPSSAGVLFNLAGVPHKRNDIFWWNGPNKECDVSMDHRHSQPKQNIWMGGRGTSLTPFPVFVSLFPPPLGVPPVHVYLRKQPPPPLFPPLLRACQPGSSLPTRPSCPSFPGLETWCLPLLHCDRGPQAPVVRSPDQLLFSPFSTCHSPHLAGPSVFPFHPPVFFTLPSFKPATTTSSDRVFTPSFFLPFPILWSSRPGVYL